MSFVPFEEDSIRVLALSWRDLNHPEAGGAEKYLETICAGLARRGHQVVLSCPHYPGAAADESPNGVRYVRHGARLSVYPGTAARLALGKLGAPDVIVDINNGIPFFSPLVAPCPVVGVVHHIHREQWPVVFGPAMAALGWSLESRLAPWVYRHSTMVAVSETTRSEMRSIGYHGDISVVYNGTEMPGMQRRPRSATPVIAVLGRLVPHKRVEHALEVAARLRGEFPGLKLVVIGDGWHSDRLKEAAARAGVADMVEFTGFVSQGEKHRLLASAWLHLCPSMKEGWGLSVMEAGWHRVPSVAYQGAGALSESIVDQQTGVLVPPGVGHLTAQVRELLRSPDVISQLGLAAHRRAGQFTWRRTVADFEQVLQSAVERSSGQLPHVRGAERGRWELVRLRQRSATRGDAGVTQGPAERHNT